MDTKSDEFQHHQEGLSDERPPSSELASADDGFERAFSDRKRKQQAAMIPLALAMLFVLLKDQLPEGTIREVIQDQTFAFVVIAVLVFFAYSLFNWRCPSCNRYLGQRLSPKTCPHCGAHLAS